MATQMTQDPLDAVTQLFMKQQGGQYGAPPTGTFAGSTPTMTSSSSGTTATGGGGSNVTPITYPPYTGLPNTGINGGALYPSTSAQTDPYGNPIGITDPGQGPNKSPVDPLATNGIIPDPPTVGGGYTGLAPDNPSNLGNFPQQANKATTSAVAGGDLTGNGPVDFGNLSDPTTWMGLVANPTKLAQWIQQSVPGASPAMVQQYVNYIQGQPGANATEQAGSANYWLQKMQTDPQLTGGTGGTGSSAGGVFGSQVGGIGAGGPQDAVFNLLMQRANQNVNVGPNDPIIKGQTDAYDATQQRARTNYLQQIAEQAGPGANTTAEARASASTVGSNDAAYQAGLMGTERTALRQQAQAALSGAYGFLTSEQQMQLTQLLHNLDLQEQGYEFDTNQAYLNSPAAHPTA